MQNEPLTPWIDQDYDALFEGSLRPASPSGWHEHVPFAHWIVQQMHPRCLVELGTHYGVSYSAFCNAIAKSRLNTRAFAVDSWLGDENVYEEFKKFHDSLFSSFSVLIRSNFDDAGSYFPDGSIDLLHVDGCHSYEAVRAVFIDWLPKMSERGVVLLHATNVGKRQFGVRKFWEEVSASHPHFEFLHGHGLGVLGVGTDLHPIIRKLLNTTDESAAMKIRNRFAAAGQKHSAVYLAETYEMELSRERASAAALEAELKRVQSNYSEQNWLLSEVAKLKRENDKLRIQASTHRIEAATKARDIQSLHQSTSWRLTKPIRAVKAHTSRISLAFELQRRRARILLRALNPADNKARGIIKHAILRQTGRSLSPVSDGRYAEWIERFDCLNKEDLELIQQQIEVGDLPRIGALVLLSRDTIVNGRRVAASLKQQLYALEFIAILLPEGISAEEVARIQSEFRNQRDVFVLNSKQESALIPPTDALLMIEGSAILREHASISFACEMRDRDARLVYSDEDMLTSGQGRAEPFFKPDYSPMLAASTHYMGSCGLVRVSDCESASLVSDLRRAQSVARFMTAFAQRQLAGDIVHIPLVLFSESRPERCTLVASPKSAPFSDQSRTVSIIIPTKDRVELLRACVDSVIERTAYPREKYELIVVNNGSCEQRTIVYLEQAKLNGSFVVLDYNEEFNYSRLNNYAVANSKSDVVVFLNNDTVIVQPDWLDRLVHQASIADVGAVGVKLLYPDLTVQHGGVILGIQGVAAHAFVNLSQDAPGYRGLATIDHEVSAVTGACLAIRREVFHAIGGFDENLEVAFGDTLLCVMARKNGYRNVMLESVKVIHHESKSRGYDDTPEKIAAFRRECLYARVRANEYFQNDTYYSPNLSLQDPYRLAFPPRREKPWRRRRLGKPRVLLLSVTHRMGHGVPVVMAQQAAFLVSRGYDVHIGGPVATNEVHYTGCTRISLDHAHEAALYAVEKDIDCIVAETPPFFSIARWTGSFPKIVVLDHGEPPPALFLDNLPREEALLEKSFVFAMAHRLCAISESVKVEAGAEMKIIPNANSHLATWDEEKRVVRDTVRARSGWSGKVVVLNVCRFHEAERRYKGIDFYISVAQICQLLDDASGVVFVMCGKADPDDIAYVESAGLTVKANVSDAELSELYAAADIYVSFSQWEGWNLGISQALAFGIPVVASDIPAHRNNFSVPVFKGPAEAARHLANLARTIVEAGFNPARNPIVTPWEDTLVPFAEVIDDVCGLVEPSFEKMAKAQRTA
ncbi:GT2 family glycosyltransferase [Bradyrhizobium sp. GM5.1]